MKCGRATRVIAIYLFWVKNEILNKWSWNENDECFLKTAERRGRASYIKTCSSNNNIFDSTKRNSYFIPRVIMYRKNKRKKSMRMTIQT